MNRFVLDFLPPDLAADDEANTSTFKVELSDYVSAEAAEGRGRNVPAALAGVTPMSAGDVDKLLKRVEKIETDAGDVKDFHMRGDSLAPPKTGRIVEIPFPAPEAPRPEVTVDPAALAARAAELAGPVSIVRFSPEGMQKKPVTAWSVTFNQPMVAVSSVGEVEQSGPKVSFEPAVPGRARWTGATTLQFEPEHRLPYATNYSVIVPAGTRSALGNTLDKDFAFHFTTDDPNLVTSSPSRGRVVQSLLPTIFLGFDQRVNPAAVLAVTKATCNRTPVTLTLVPHDEVKAHSEFKSYVRGQTQGDATWFAVRPTAPLDNDAEVRIALGPHIPSEEGPRVSEKTFDVVFRTYPQFDIVPRDKDVRPPRPGEGWTVTFTNPVDRKSCRKELIKVVPECPGLRLQFPPIVLDGQVSSFTLLNDSAALTEYTVTVDHQLKDIHGQNLRNNTMKVKTGHAYVTGDVSGASGMMILDPASPPVYTAIVYNYAAVRVMIFQVKPTDYPEYNQNGVDRERDIPIQFGKLVHKENIPNTAGRDKPFVCSINLLPHLQHKDEGLGQLVVFVEPEPAAYAALQDESGVHSHSRNRPTASAWIQATRMAVDAYNVVQEKCELLSWVSQLSSGAPMEGAQISFFNAGWGEWQRHRDAKIGEAAATDAAGLAVSVIKEKVSNVLTVATRGNDVVFAEPMSVSTNTIHENVWFTFDDRHLYKPNETVHVKGIVRAVSRHPETGAVALAPATGGVKWKVTDSQWNDILAGDVVIGPHGSFVIHFTLPDRANLGTATVEFSRGRETHRHSFEMQEFRRPEFEVSSSYRPTSRHITADGKGSFAIATAKASYFAGGPLTGAVVSWNVKATKASFSPAGWGEFSFQKSQSWWRCLPMDDEKSYGQWNFDGVTDQAGEHELKIAYEGNDDPPTPINIRASGAVYDVNNQALQTNTGFLLHPSNLYVGYRLKNSWGKAGEAFEFDTIVVDIEGRPVAGVGVVTKITKKFQRLVEDDQGLSSWQPESASEEHVYTSPDGAHTHSIVPDVGGDYTLAFAVVDAEGRRNGVEAVAYIQGARRNEQQSASNARVPVEEALLVPDKQEYMPGETAQLLVRSPFLPAEGLLRVVTSKTVVRQRFRMDQETLQIPIKIEDSWVPDCNVLVELIGTAPRLNALGAPDDKQAPRPACASATASLKVDLRTRTLAVTATPAAASLAPGSDTSVAVSVVDHAGAPVAGAEVTVIVVDESVLSLTGCTIADPLSIFYPRDRYASFNYSRGRSSVLLLGAEELDSMMQAMKDIMGAVAAPVMKSTTTSALPMAMMMPAPCAAACSGLVLDDGCEGLSARSCCCCCEGESGTPLGMAADAAAALSEGAGVIAVRRQFDPLAVFEGGVVTDKDGRAVVNYKLPDSLTRYRVWAIASTIDRFGRAESAVTAELPLMIRPSPPRFFNFGDHAKISVVLQNQTAEPRNAVIAMSVTNASVAEGTGGYMATIPPAGRGAISFPVATRQVGTARFQFVVGSGAFADAAEVEVPVYTPATSEAFATYGEVADTESVVMQPVHAPKGVLPQFGGLEVSTSSTALSALTDAIMYLSSYQFECAEQLASRVLGIVSVMDILYSFNVKDLPPPAQLMKSIQRDLAEIKRRQLSNGGFGWWRNDEDVPYVSVHVANCIAKCAEGKGIEVDAELKRGCIRYLNSIREHVNTARSTYMASETTKNAIIAYSLAVKSHLNLPNEAGALDLLGQGFDKLTLESLGWLLTALSHKRDADRSSKAKAAIDKILKHLHSHVSETAETAHFVTSYGDDGAYVMLHSERRADGVILDGLLAAHPDDFVTKIAKGLLAHRKKGRWESTQENCFVLIALDHYFRVREGVTPDFVARIWLGDTYGGEQAFKGRTTETNLVNIPMSTVLEGGDKNLILQKEGKGRLYYRVGLKYAPESLSLAPANYGFEIVRVYEGIDSPDHVRKNADGTWAVKLGEKVRVRVKMTTTDRRYHVALVDKLPAGFEALNPALKGTVEAPITGGERPGPFMWFWCNPLLWYDHQNLRDERAEAFKGLLWEGKYEYQYIARATTEGRFVVPPAKAEEMYSPEIFGRSGTDIVVVAP